MKKRWIKVAIALGLMSVAGVAAAVTVICTGCVCSGGQCVCAECHVQGPNEPIPAG
jgi:hypothetical protein